MQIIFEQPQVQSVTNTVTTAIEEVRLNHFEDIVAEFDLSTNWVKNSLRVSIFESYMVQFLYFNNLGSSQ